MKKITKYILSVVCVAAFANAFTSCENDDLESASIFNTTEAVLDPSSFSFPLDTFCKKNFLEPYNMQFKYKMEDIMIDQQKNLVPVTYERACEMAVLSKYLWYEAYEKIVCSQNPDFMKIYSPRIVHLVGSRSHNTSSNTITWGYASNGVQITLQGLNTLPPSDLYRLNKYALHTMHHEFSHLLQQTTSTPPAFRTISQGLYEPASWQSISDSVSLSKGFVTSYASESQTEDWVEVISCYITDDPIKWEQKLNTASYDWMTIEDTKQDSIINIYKGKSETRKSFNELAETVNKESAVESYYQTYKSMYINKLSKEEQNAIKNNPAKMDSIDNILSPQKNSQTFVKTAIKRVIDSEWVNPDSVGFFYKKTSTESDAQGNAHLIGVVVRKNIERDQNDRPLLDPETWDIIYKYERGFVGKDIILQKLEMAKEWLKENFKYDLEAMRKEIQDRSYAKNPDGTFRMIPIHEVGSYESYVDNQGFTHDYPYDRLNRDTYRMVNLLTEPDANNPSKTLMESLLDMINQYKTK